MSNRKYTPRRAGKRWLDDAPAYILDCFDIPDTGDRYTVLFGKGLMFHVKHNGDCMDGSDQRNNTIVPYLAMSEAPGSPQGISMWGELEAHQAAAYRYNNGHRRIRWLDFPAHIRKHVIARVEI